MTAPLRPVAALTSADARRCPLCGGLNQCAVATTGELTTDCWCRTARIAPEVLARIPAEQRLRACVCPACAGQTPERPAP